MQLPNLANLKNSKNFVRSSYGLEGLRGTGSNGYFSANDTSKIFGPDGVTPVSAPGDLVYIASDVWDGIQTGAELVTGGATLGAGWSGTGPWVKAAGAANSATWSVGTLTSGKTYAVEVNYSALTASTITPRLTGGATLAGAAVSVAGTYREMFTATAAHTTLDLLTTATTAGTVASVSVREVLNWPAYQPVSTAQPKWGWAPAEVRNLCQGATDAPGVIAQPVWAVQHTLSFTGTGSVARSGVSTGTLAGTGVNDRVQVAFTPTAGTLTLTPSGDVRNMQLEHGAAATAYQTRGASVHDITESGVPSLGKLAFDLSDDKLVLLNSKDASLVWVAVHTRGGSYRYPAPISVAAAKQLVLGPTSLVNDGVQLNPRGVMRIGIQPWSLFSEVVGYSMFSKTAPTEADWAREMRYYRAKGAKGWLVETPVVGYDFNAGLHSFTGGNGATLSNPSGRLRVTNTATNGLGSSPAITVTPGIPHIYRADFITNTATGNSFMYVGSSVGNSNYMNENLKSVLGSHACIFVPPAPTVYLQQAMSNASLAGEYNEWDNISLAALTLEP